MNEPYSYNRSRSQHTLLKTSTIILFVGIILGGCNTTHYLKSPLDANHGPLTDHALIVLRSGESIEARNINVDTASTRFWAIRQEADTVIKTNDIEKLHVTDYLSGTVGGFVFGGLGGFAGGVLAAKMMGTPLVQGEKINGYLYGAVGFLIGGTYGVIYGLTHGRQDDYLFPASVRPQR